MLASARYRALATAALFCLGLFQAGCSTIDVSADWDPQAPFERMRTWAWAPERATTIGPDPRLESDLLHRRIQTAVATELAEHGYRNAGPGEKPDFYVAYHLGIDKELNARTLYNNYMVGPYYAGPWMMPETQVDMYEVGTLLLDVIDTQRDQLIWRGTARARIQGLDDPREREERVEEAVGKLLERFPPQENA